MQIHAKKVYEFIQKKSLKNSINNDIGINHIIIKEIKEWFKEYLPDTYKNINIYINGNKEIIVDGNLKFHDFSNNYIKKSISFFPNIDIINGEVDFSMINIDKFPDNLIINGNLTFFFARFKKLPKNLTINGSLYLEYSDIKILPDDLKISDYIYTTNFDFYGIPNHLKNKLKEIKK